MRKFNIITTPLSLLVSSILFFACGNNQNQQQDQVPAIPVSTYTVDKRVVTEEIEYPGKITGLKEVELRSYVNGYITGVFFEEGTQVKKGQKLYEIDRTKYLASYQSALANLRSAQAILEKSRKDYERYKALDAKQAIAKQRLDYAQTDINTAQAQVEAAKASLSAAKNDLDNSVITAPFTGTIGISQLKVGSLVTAGSTLINTISNTNPVAVDIQIDQKELGFFLSMANNAAARKDSVFTLLVDGQNQPVLGTIAAIDRAVDPATGTIKVRVAFQNPKEELRIGMNCTLSVRKKTSGEVVVIPYQAVTEQLGEFSVFLLGDSNKVEQTPVKLGIKTQADIVVNEGLKAGDVIVSEGAQNLKNGAVVNPSAPEKNN